jgi:hypothetical protein
MYHSQIQSMTIRFSIKSSFVSTVTLWMAIIISRKHNELITCTLTNRYATGWKKIDSYVYLLHRNGIKFTVLYYKVGKLLTSFEFTNCLVRILARTQYPEGLLVSFRPSRQIPKHYFKQVTMLPSTFFPIHCSINYPTIWYDSTWDNNTVK